MPAIIVGSSWDIREVAKIQTGLCWIDGRKLLRPSPVDQALEIVYLSFKISVLCTESTNLACCRFRGHRVKMFLLKPESMNAKTNIQPRV